MKIRSFLLGLLPVLVCVPPMYGQGLIQRFSLDQVSFAATHSGSVPCSEYGYASFTLNQLTGRVQMLQILVQTAPPGGPAGWLVRNVPVAIGSVTAEAATVDLTQLGVRRGTCINGSTVAYQVILTDAPINAAPAYTVPTGSITVGQRTDRAEGDIPAGTFSPGSLASSGPPALFTFAPGPIEFIDRRGMGNVVQGPNECAPGAVTNSMRWLDTAGKINLGGETEAQTLAKLKADMQPAGWTGRGVSQTETVRGKLCYAQEHNLDLVIHYQADSSLTDLGASFAACGRTATRNGTGGPPTFAYLKQEMAKGQDVELSIDWLDNNGNKTGGHVIVVSGVLSWGNLTGIFFNDDTQQNGQPGGARTDAFAKIENEGPYMKLGGLARNRIKAIYSESPSPNITEIDAFPASRALITISTPLGTDKVALVGPTTVAADIGHVGDSNHNGLDDIATEMTQLDLEGISALLGPVTVRLRSPAKRPSKRTTGLIEETVNLQPGRLDVPPFAPSGTATSYFDVFFELEAPGAPQGFQILHNETPAHMTATITNKPPKPGETYTATGVLLLDETGGETPVTLSSEIHIPFPPILTIPSTGVVNSGSFTGSVLAPASITTVIGQNLSISTLSAPGSTPPTYLAGTRLVLTDSAGVELYAPLYFVSPGQINLLLPDAAAPGPASLRVVSGDGTISVATIQIAGIGPGVFAANSNGKGSAAAVAVRVAQDASQAFQLTFTCDPQTRNCATQPIDLGSATDQVYLELYATGIRGLSSLAGASVLVGSTRLPVSYAGPQGQFAGLDQVNVLLPRNLIGSGEVPVALTVDGVAANVVTINIK